MEESQRSRSHTVTTTASSFAENFSTTSSSFAYDREFLRTLPGLLIVAEIVSVGPGCGRQVDPANSRVSSSAHRAGSGLPAGSGNALELSLDFFVKCKTHIPVLSPWALLGTDGRDPQDVCCGRVPSLLFSFEDGGLSREPDTRWAFIDLELSGIPRASLT